MLPTCFCRVRLAVADAAVVVLRACHATPLRAAYGLLAAAIAIVATVQICNISASIPAVFAKHRTTIVSVVGIVSLIAGLFVCAFSMYVASGW